MKKKFGRSVADATLNGPEKPIRAETFDGSQAEQSIHRCTSVNQPVPAAHTLSNGQYTVMLTAEGAGFSRVNNLAVTRWREDLTRDNFGFFLYIKDTQSKNIWSASHQPICSESDRYQVSFSENSVKFEKSDFGIESRVEIFVSPEENAEFRQLALTNLGSSTRELEITSYCEVVLNSRLSDLAHPAFSNLFVETEFDPKTLALIARRRPRSRGDKRIWMMHSLHTDFPTVGPLQYETDRSRFLGRGRSLKRPSALFESENLSDTTGSVLDPVMSLRRRIHLAPGETCRLTFALGVTESRETIHTMCEKFANDSAFDRIRDLSTCLISSDPSQRAVSEEHNENINYSNGKQAKEIPLLKNESSALMSKECQTVPLTPKLEFFNGQGGFSREGHEYSIFLQNTETTPAPWINVIASSEFGFQVSESGSGYTWSSNSRENQLTPWSNDPVRDPSGEAFFIRDCDSGAVWGPTASPIRCPHANYAAHHGQGYSRFETQVDGIFSELKQFVLIDQPVKISRLRLENRTDIKRKLALSSYVEWVLGFSRCTTSPTLVTEFDEPSQAIFAFNPKNPEHGTKVAFSAVLQKHTSFTCNRTEFIGRNSDLSQPAGIFCDKLLSRAFGCDLDSCAAIQTEVRIPAGKAVEVIFILGQSADRGSAQNLIEALREEMDLNHEFDRVKAHWNSLLETVQVETPDRSFDLMLNRWLLYQTIVCRIWARAGFYQAGGAFGFRDQLQDVMAVMLASPSMAREHILRAASRQFVEGDVQHWWHPPLGRGVRTRFSDDLLWLPYVVSHYLDVTQDHSILDEMVSFLEGPSLLPEQEDSYFLPNGSVQVATLYEHCARAIDKSLRLGQHGLPLMGGGDWNDGMNLVGSNGQGESVWLAWFLISNLKNFAKIAANRNDGDRAKKWKKHGDLLAESAEKNAWDGSWYRRAYFDDGTPLGSSENSECQIDSLPQTWAVISGAAQSDRARIAMKSVYEKLVKSHDKLILLLTPPFDQTSLDPGYIKGYLPGVRENGGQYTHAASWVVIATALLGDRERAWNLFSFLNPIQRSLDLANVNRYKIEPYVLPGDVYSEEPNTGRGGWSWYTGAAGWLYRAGIEYILGLQVRGDKIIIKPCVPPEWKQFKFRYKYKSSSYHFHIQIDGSQTITEAQSMQLVDDGKEHEVCIRFSSFPPDLF